MIKGSNHSKGGAKVRTGSKYALKYRQRDSTVSVEEPCVLKLHSVRNKKFSKLFPKVMLENDFNGCQLPLVSLNVPEHLLVAVFRCQMFNSQRL